MNKERWQGDKASLDWLVSFESKKNTQSTYATGWRRFLEYAGMTGDQILADRKADREFRWEKETLAFKQWMVAEKGLSENSARTAAQAAEGFFSFHRLNLKFRKSEASAISKAKRKTEDYRFSRDDLKKMADFADLTERYIIVAGKSFGLRAGDFQRLKRGDLEPYVDREPPISIGEIYTQKEGVKAFPFIDSDAKPVIKNVLEAMDREGRTGSDERVLDFKDERPLSEALQRAADRAGIKYGNKNVRFHCLRKFLIDHLSNYMAESKWKQIVGKTIPESAYVSPDQLREDYQRAMGETAFEKPEGDLETKIKAEVAKKFLQSLGIDWRSIRTMTREKLRREPTLKEEVEAYEEAERDTRKTQANGGCRDSEHCQKVVGEEELPSLLANGWHVAAVLPSGKVVIANEYSMPHV